MITKESLIEAKESVNIAILKLKQTYSNSSSSKKVFFIVEGKDDIPFYGSKSTDFIPNDWKLQIIDAKNRNKVIEAHDNIDWSIYNKKLVYFFVDKDLSDYTQEYTPKDSNIYITNKYAIENDLCTFDTLLKTLKYYYSLNDMDDADEKIINQLYDNWLNAFSCFAESIMAQILYWKLNKIDSNYSNFRIQGLFEIRNDSLIISPPFSSEDDTLKELCRQSGIAYSIIDISEYKELLNSKHTFIEYVRGKYILAFWIKSLIYISKNSESILPSKKKSKDTIGVGYENAISKLCGIMKLPETLYEFFTYIHKTLIEF